MLEAARACNRCPSSTFEDPYRDHEGDVIDTERTLLANQLSLARAVRRRFGLPAMSLCANCGRPTFGPEELCTYHHDGGESWATGNRIMCDFIHRGRVASLPRGRSRPTMSEEIEGARQ